MNGSFCKKVRCHNRRIHKNIILKGGYRKRNQAEHEIKGFRLFDKVRCGSTECFIFARRSTGYMNVRMLDGTKINAGISYKKLQFVSPAKHLLIERRRYIL